MTLVDWTSMIYMILYIPLVFPGSWILDKLVSSYRHGFGMLSWAHLNVINPNLMTWMRPAVVTRQHSQKAENFWKPNISTANLEFGEDPHLPGMIFHPPKDFTGFIRETTTTDSSVERKNVNRIMNSHEFIVKLPPRHFGILLKCASQLVAGGCSTKCFFFREKASLNKKFNTSLDYLHNSFMKA